MESDFVLALKVLSGITCLLSMVGAGFIIATYAAFRDLRTLGRQQLVNLSLADMIVAASHFVGLAALNVDKYELQYSSSGNGNSSNYSTVQDTLCRVQAGFTMFATLASFLWTLALGAYMLAFIALRRPETTRYLLLIYYPACWGVPLVLTMWFGLVKPTYLGFGEGADIGWCYIRVVPDSKGRVDHTTTVVAEVLGYELWFYGTFASLAVIYITLLCYIKFTGIKHKKHIKKSTDLKLVLVPVIFFLLRVWSAIIDIVHYARLNQGENPSDPDENGRLYALLLLAGIGDSAQGLANGILFCAFTKQVRSKLLKTAHSHLCCWCPQSFSHLKEWWETKSVSSYHSTVVHEATTQLDGESVSEHLSGTVRGSSRCREVSPILDTVPEKYGT